MRSLTIKHFEHWRTEARRLILSDVRPESIQLIENDGQRSLFGDAEDVGEASSEKNEKATKPFSVSKAFMTLAQTVSYHRNKNRWDLLYRTLWRLTHDQPRLLEVTTDDDVYQLTIMEKQVRRDAHKMKAFVRFRRIESDGVEHFIAWHRPDHRIVGKVAPFFARRFNGMNWTILTPQESAVWNQQELVFGAGVPRNAAPQSDELEELWKTYYRSIFNPARVKVKMMKSEMPVRYWDTMPEAEIIADLLHEAPQRVETMIEQHEGFDKTAADFFTIGDAGNLTLETLNQRASACQACDLYKDATQTVVGVGPVSAKIVLLGEQPGDREDLSGKPFVGPAGQVLNEALLAAGIDRDAVYITNVVKHFKHTTTDSAGGGKQRLHKKPNAREVRCCRPWFDAEWSLLTEAEVLVCLGATAATAIIGPGFKVSKQRGNSFGSDYCDRTIATWHPSAILRTQNGETRKEKVAQLVADLKLALAVQTRRASK